MFAKEGSGNEGGTFLARMRQRRRCRRAEASMLALDDRILRDIGLTRPMIAAAAWGRCRAAAPDRRRARRLFTTTAVLGACIAAAATGAMS